MSTSVAGSQEESLPHPQMIAINANLLFVSLSLHSWMREE